MATGDEVRRIALSLPGAYEQESYGGCRSWRTEPRTFTCIRDDPDAVVVWVASFEDKETGHPSGRRWRSRRWVCMCPRSTRGAFPQ